MIQRIRQLLTDHRVRRLQRRVDALLFVNLKHTNALRELNRAHVRLLARHRRARRELTVLTATRTRGEQRVRVG